MTLPGFSESTGENNAITIWCNSLKTDSWYVRQDDKNTVLPPELLGQLTAIKLWTKPAGEFNEQHKISFKVFAAGQNYELATGSLTPFAKCLLGVIATAPAGTFDKEIKIVARPGKKVLLCAVYNSTGDWLKGLEDWPSHDWDKITEQAIWRLNGEEPPAAELSKPVGKPVAKPALVEDEDSIEYMTPAEWGPKFKDAREKLGVTDKDVAIEILREAGIMSATALKPDRVDKAKLEKMIQAIADYMSAPQETGEWDIEELPM